MFLGSLSLHGIRCIISKKLPIYLVKGNIYTTLSQLCLFSDPNMGQKVEETITSLFRFWRGERIVGHSLIPSSPTAWKGAGVARRGQPSSSYTSERRGKAKWQLQEGREGRKHKGICIQIFKHSWKDAWTETPFFCSPCRSEFNTQPDANAKWLELFLASIAKLLLFVKCIEFSCGYSSWLHSASICTFFFSF